MIKPQIQLFPFCIVWIPIPCLTWLIPIIGHAAICDSKGTIYQFLGYTINTDYSAFGRVVKYARMFPDCEDSWNKGVKQANQKYEKQRHNLCCNNCHHHVADALNFMKYQGKQNWSQLDIWWLCLSRSSYADKCDILKVYLPFLIILGLVLGLAIGLS